MKRRNAGFTLIELMIVVLVVAIVLSIAYPSYRKQVLKSRRADAKTALTESAHSLERCFTEFGAYDDTNCSIVTNEGSGPTVSLTSDEGYYTVSSPTLTATTFTLRAEPTSQGGQDDDTDCDRFEIDQTGVKSAWDSGGSANGNCW